MMMRFVPQHIYALVLCGVWQELSKLAEKATGIHIETVAAAPKEGIVPKFVSGDTDLLLIHGSDESYALQAEGLAAPLCAWAYNEHVIVEPSDDPAKIAEVQNGINVIRRISTANAAMIGFRDPGSFTIMQHLWWAADLRPSAKQHAYAVVWHIPVAFGKMPMGDYRVLLSGDPAMRRVYVLVEPGSRHPVAIA
jgi:tungstate transport system substrate-binding protein